MTEEERSERRRRRTALLLIPLLLGAAFCFWTLFASVSLGEAESFIPAPLGSNALANYGKDDLPGRLRSLSISIVEAVIRDRDPEEENVGSRVEDVSNSLKSPVPTVTPKPGDPTGTPTSPPTTTSTPDLSVTGTVTATGSPSPSPIASRTPTATHTDEPTAGPTSTVGPSSTPSKTPAPSKTPTITLTPPCKVPPYIEIISPLPDQRFTLAEVLPGQAFAFDPDNVNPLTCSTTPSTFPDDDGEGISGDPEVEMRIEWWSGSSWILVHTELEKSKAYCPFGDIDPFCDTHDLSTGEWPDSTPISTGRHRLKAKVLQDDEGVPSGWSVPVDFYIDPAPTATPTFTPTPTNTSTSTPTPTYTPTPTVDPCLGISLTGFNKSGSEAWMTLTNGPAATVEIDQIDVSWGFSADLSAIQLAGNGIWAGDLSSPVSITTGWSGSVLDRQLGPSGSGVLKFIFESGASASGYSIYVHFTNTCDASLSN